jgi:site-specific DNA-methyltransferase (adenine-specific)
VADLMCGSATTLVVAARLGRRFVGGDVSPVAIEVARQRLEAEAIGYRFARASSAASLRAAHMPLADARPLPARS